MASPGCVAIALLALPLFAKSQSLPVPIETLQFATMSQSFLLVILASVAGTRLGPMVGLGAPVLSAIANRGDMLSASRPLWMPGVIGGLIGAVVIVGFHAYSPSELAATQGKMAIPLSVRVLYGGITEEVLVRWGLMTLLVWVGWRIFQQASEKPHSSVVWMAICLSALLFGVSHVPATAAILGTVPAMTFAYVVIVNAIFGVVAGCLYWRYGLEAAIIAHILAHLLAYLVRG